MVDKTIKFSENIAPIFYPVHKAIRDETHFDFFLKGGRNSTKSSFVPLQIIKGIIEDPEANAVIYRKVAGSIAISTKMSTLWAISKLELNEFFCSIKSPHQITYKPTGQVILFKGLDEAVKSKSIRTEKGYFKYLWFEEGEEYDGEDEIRSVEESVLRGSKYFKFITYNPPRSESHWINRLCKKYESDPTKYIHHSTYLDIPQEWVSPKTRSNINDLIGDDLAEKDYEKYAHEYLGKCIGNPAELVFSGKYEVKDFETPPLSEVEQKRFFFGCDWGLTNDPTVLIRCFIKDKYLYVDYESYELEVDIEYIGSKIFDKIPESKKWMIEADHSEIVIRHVRNQGYQIRKALKGAGSVEQGIKYLKSFQKIIIHSRCKRLIKEFENYSYRIDKHTKEVLPEIDDKKNRIKTKQDTMGIKDDGIDSLRYAMSRYSKVGATTMGFRI